MDRAWKRRKIVRYSEMDILDRAEGIGIIGSIITWFGGESDGHQ